jgi:hypothetical protein
MPMCQFRITNKEFDNDNCTQVLLKKDYEIDFKDTNPFHFNHQNQLIADKDFKRIVVLI